MIRTAITSAQANWLLLGSLCLGTLPGQAAAADRWRNLGNNGGESRLRLQFASDREIRSDQPFFVITHGMSGIREGDRFHRLANTLAATMPEANIILMDWSETSRSSLMPQVVAWKINSVADEASQALRELGFQPERATLIGESFGNYVNARIASNLGKVRCMLAMNPASGLAGYPIPDLRQCATVSWSFHAYSNFDTCQTLAHATILLDAPEEATDIEKHTLGIERLSERLAQGDLEWLLAQRDLPKNQPGRFKVLATTDGRLTAIDLPRIRAAQTVSPEETQHLATAGSIMDPASIRGNAPSLVANN